MISKKQLQANQRNAQKSTGPKTPEGKALAKRNSLKHGLLAKEVVITEGEGAEDQQAFDALLANYVDHCSPVGPLEEIQVEVIMTSYWLLCRAQSYEVGILRQHLDTVSEDYYDEDGNETDAQIDKQIEEKQQKVKALRGDLEELKKLHEQGKDLSVIYDRVENWQWIERDVLDPDYIFIDIPPILIRDSKPYDENSVEEIKQALNEKGLTDDQIWQVHIGLCDEKKELLNEIEQLKKDKVKNKLRLSAIKQRGLLPPKSEMDNLLRNKTAINRQMNQAINQLERMQRRRQGDHVPPPIQVDINTLGPGNLKLSE